MAGESAGFRYTIKDMTNTFGISRTNLLYYEKIGIIRPDRTGEAGYRVYDEMDVFRLMGAILLKSTGIQPKDLARRLDNDPFRPECFDEYLRCSERRIEYDCAVHECLRRLAHLRGNVGAIEIADIEPYYICWDEAEQGYHNFPPTKNLGLLMDHLPLGSFGSFGNDSYVGGFDEVPVSIRWGRTISVRNAGLIDGLDHDMDMIGGCRCVCFSHFEPDLYAMTQPQESTRQDHERIISFMHAARVKQAGEAFWPYTLPSGEGFFVMTCIPVKPIS